MADVPITQSATPCAGDEYMHCTYCGSHRHTQANCPKTWAGSANRAHMRCSCCGGRDHTLAACPKTHGGSAARAWHPEDVADHFIKDA